VGTQTVALPPRKAETSNAFGDAVMVVDNKALSTNGINDRGDAHGWELSTDSESSRNN
jgi:hypothetical protein